MDTTGYLQAIIKKSEKKGYCKEVRKDVAFLLDRMHSCHQGVLFAYQLVRDLLEDKVRPMDIHERLQDALATLEDISMLEGEPNRCDTCGEYAQWCDCNTDEDDDELGLDEDEEDEDSCSLDEYSEDDDDVNPY